MIEQSIRTLVEGRDLSRDEMAAVFGEGGPDQTADDTDPREDAAGKGDDWYRDQVPPHHG